MAASAGRGQGEGAAEPAKPKVFAALGIAAEGEKKIRKKIGCSLKKPRIHRPRQKCIYGYTLRFSHSFVPNKQLRPGLHTPMCPYELYIWYKYSKTAPLKDSEAL
jgi:hypothetical protein